MLVGERERPDFSQEMRICQFVCGPAGSGKSTFCAGLERYLKKRGCTLVNLDPSAGEDLRFDASIDVRDLINPKKILDLKLGPNGALVFCMEYLASHLHWLRDQLATVSPGDDEHFILDCPGQIELYTHVPAVKMVLRALKSWGYIVCGTFIVDAAMVVGDPSKFLSAILLATSTMIQLEMPWLSLLSKVDLLGDGDPSEHCNIDFGELKQQISQPQKTALGKKWSALNQAIYSLVENYSLVQFIPLDSSDPESIEFVAQHLDIITQYGEDVEPMEPRQGEDAEDRD